MSDRAVDAQYRWHSQHPDYIERDPAPSCLRCDRETTETLCDDCYEVTHCEACGCDLPGCTCGADADARIAMRAHQTVHITPVAARPGRPAHLAVFGDLRYHDSEVIAALRAEGIDPVLTGEAYAADGRVDGMTVAGSDDEAVTRALYAVGFWQVLQSWAVAA